MQKGCELHMELLDGRLFHKGYIDGITILNLEGEILFSAKFNKKLSNMEESQQLVGQKFLSVYENMTPQNSTLYRAMELGRPVYEEGQRLKRHGKDAITITALSFPIKSGDRIVGAIDLSTQDSEEPCACDEDKIKLNKEDFRHNQTQKLTRDPCAYVTFDDIIAVNENMRQIKEYIKVVSSCDLPVMIYGETGTGKDVFAQAIHSESARRDKPFITQNCAAIPETLLESVLFGTAKGAFTGAVESKGLLELADGGTLFLDELNSMPLYLQSKLLRVLQGGTFRSLGSASEKHVDVKIIAALNQDPIQAISSGHLRQDIYYRLSIMSISIPPLRERTEDIQTFVECFIQRHNQTFHKDIHYVSQDLIQQLKAYSWPGNVRELEHIIVYGMSMVAPGEDTLRFCHIEKQFRALAQAQAVPDNQILSCSLPQAMDAYERTLIENALKQAKWNISHCAKLLGIPRQTLQRKLRHFELSQP